MIEIRHRKTRVVVYRHKGALAGADLRRADLRHANLKGMDLSGANLSGAALSGANLSKVNLSGAILDGADLSGANLDRATLHATSFRSARLHDAHLPVSAIQCDFTEAGLHAVKKEDGRTSGKDAFVECDFTGADLRGADLRGLVFRNCSFRGADMREARMDGISPTRSVGFSITGQSLSGVIGAVFASIPAMWHEQHWISGQQASMLKVLIGIAIAVGITLLLVRYQPCATFEGCDFTGARHDATTRWPKRFLPGLRESSTG